MDQLRNANQILRIENQFRPSGNIVLRDRIHVVHNDSPFDRVSVESELTSEITHDDFPSSFLPLRDLLIEHLIHPAASSESSLADNAVEFEVLEALLESFQLAELSIGPHRRHKSVRYNT